ncbi:MAG TPA: hypothetical protein VJN42_11680 [Candidatus Acidoferrum sp.]|nr:hypothetical protein [Candidatus Acidoferrum sp.]
MKRNSVLPARNRKQGGYALLLVLFLTALVLIGSMSIGLRVLTEGRRQKEQEMIWRGKQYTRGIKLYYRKFGRFPTSLDNLTLPSGPDNLRFMRRRYEDPMNKQDGSWRLIYVGPAGQLIGSLKPQAANLQMPSIGGVGRAAAGFGGFGSTANPSGGISSGGTTTGVVSTGSTAAATGAASGAQSADSSGTAPDQGAPLGDTPTIIGGNIIGVGSKINQSSIIVYEDAKNYRLFEFIWDPSKDLAMALNPGNPTGAPAGASGQNPSGTLPGITPQPNPPQPNPPIPNPNP